jgi:tRNA(fMet)-specific endonuclease VapC
VGLNERLAVDTNAVIDLVRQGAVSAPVLGEGRATFLPLPVLGELFAGAFASTRQRENISAFERVIAEWTVISPDHETAREYGRIRARAREMPNISQSRLNDLWIAAICIQHSLPLLTNDRGFDAIAGLTVIHW